jgi:hypothetical protein
MKVIKANIGNWYAECMPDDGARISILQYRGKDLLTTMPRLFNPPGTYHGEYETRAVYGYDDCFPTVDPCTHPTELVECRDHGELCWNKWQARFSDNSLFCYTKCNRPPVSFKRTLDFRSDSIIWQYEVVNFAAKQVPFLHVMHALLPLNEISYIHFPAFEKVTDENSGDDLAIVNPGELSKFLLMAEKGTYRMLLLRNITGNLLKIHYLNGIKLEINFPLELFPTLGIWWNNCGYPNEEGLRRCECAFEPISGTCSNLSVSYRDGAYMRTEPGQSLEWEVTWKIIE